MEQIADGTQFIADIFFKGKKRNQALLAPQLLNGRNIVRRLPRNVDDLDF